MAPVVLVVDGRVVGQRIGRVLSAASGLGPVAVAERFGDARAALDGPPRALFCDATHLDEARAWLDEWPALRVVLWASADVPRVLAAVRDEPRIRHVLGWPTFASIPRPWELLVAARRALDPSSSLPKVRDLVLFGAHVETWRPRTTAELGAAVDAVAERVAAGGSGERTAARVGDVVHELLMNAMYDAPIDGWGEPRYAHDRRQELALDEAEVPTLRLACDGVTVAVEVSDPFGRLRDEHVVDGIVRAADNAAGAEVRLDTRHGGAGLGIGTIYAAASALLVEVRPRVSTRVTWVADLDLNARDTRGLPASLHLFRDDPGATP